MTLLRATLLALTIAAGPALADGSATLARIAETGTFTIGYRTGEPPMSYADEAGQPSGYSVALCQAIGAEIARTLGRDDIEARYIAVTSEDRFDRLEAGEIDMLCGATTKTLSRAERVGFTQLTLITGGALLSMDAGNRVESLADLAGGRVAVAAGTSTQTTLSGLLESAGIDAEIVPMDSADASLAALQAGEVNAYAADQVVLIGKVLSQTDTSLAYFLAGDLFSFEPFALAHARGDTDFQLVADRALSRLYRTGAVVKIYERWFGPFGQAPTAAQRAVWQLGSTPE